MKVTNKHYDEEADDDTCYVTTTLNITIPEKIWKCFNMIISSENCIKYLVVAKLIERYVDEYIADGHEEFEVFLK